MLRNVKRKQLFGYLKLRFFTFYTLQEIWNMLPPHLKNSNVSRKQFKSSLKTWLFVQAYS